MNDNQETALFGYIESIAIDIKRIADSLEVLAGAKPINSIGGFSCLTDFPPQFSLVPCNEEKEDSSLVKAPEEG